jgi:hypothetical protein
MPFADDGSNTGIELIRFRDVKSQTAHSSTIRIPRLVAAEQSLSAMQDGLAHKHRVLCVGFNETFEVTGVPGCYLAINRVLYAVECGRAPAPAAQKHHANDRSTPGQGGASFANHRSMICAQARYCAQPWACERTAGSALWRLYPSCPLCLQRQEYTDNQAAPGEPVSMKRVEGIFVN